jgi:hypothetical protein
MRRSWRVSASSRLVHNASLMVVVRDPCAIFPTF